MSIFARLYQNDEYGGRSTFHLLSHGFGEVPTYAVVRRSFLDAVDMNDRTSSVTVTATASEEGGYVILFQEDRCTGRYAIFPCYPSQTSEIPELRSIDFNDRTSSVMLVRRFAHECPPIPINVLLGPYMIGPLGWTYTFAFEVTNSLSGDFRTGNISGQLEDRGYEDSEVGAGVSFTWDVTPSFSPDKTYVYVRFPLTVTLDMWPDYDCEARMWIDFYIDDGGALRGGVARFGAWVEGGLFSEGIADELMATYLPLGVSRANELISESLQSWQTLRLQHLYYLPGTDAETGHVTDGVRLVLVPQPMPR